jgi:hypothetical protein
LSPELNLLDSNTNKKIFKFDIWFNACLDVLNGATIKNKRTLFTRSIKELTSKGLIGESNKTYLAFDENIKTSIATLEDSRSTAIKTNAGFQEIYGKKETEGSVSDRIFK